MLMKQLVEVQQALKQQLQSNLTHHKRMLAEQSSPPSSSSSTTDKLDACPPDPQLVQWLQSLKVENEVISKFVYEQFTYSDVINCVTYDDLCRLDIRGGPRCRIWQAVQSCREEENG
ncbi:mitogen-activated protein kinase kinase kinase 6-like [Corticium candelabrum]|uniref:mitogen-activated protein kinase kinase kinase 6-like n=1 Tax=Corticium candelabrum TaxID=121492 RepID=UPI002E276D9C|nr:mitogen-activated protein kinase kinase kinase 6-like [Corticium candelabrum]